MLIKDKQGFSLVEALLACVAIGALMVPVFMLMNMGTKNTTMNKQEILAHAYASNVLSFIVSQGETYWKNRVVANNRTYKLEPPLINGNEVIYPLNPTEKKQEYYFNLEKPKEIRFIDDKCFCDIKIVHDCATETYRYKAVSVTVTYETANSKENTLKLSELLYEEKY